MTVKTHEAGKREGNRGYCENASKRLLENKQSVKTKKERSSGPPSKVVVRRLPPTMTEEEFQEAVTPLPDHDYFTFCSADGSLGPHAFTRAYLNFKSAADVFTFRDKFDGYVFVDQKGNEYPAMVEFAPFQKTPKKGSSKKKDARCGTVDQDPDYLAFLESITNPETVTLQPLEAMLEEIQAQDRELKANNGYLKIKTPLLEFIEQKKAEKLRSKEEKKEERRRKEFERKKAREEEKRKKKEVKEQKDMKKKDDQKEESSGSGVKLQVLRPERIKEDIQGEVKLSRKERERERYEKEKQRRMEEDRQRREREREKGKMTRRDRDRDKDKEREERMRRQEEKSRVKEEERARQREEVREDRARLREEGREERAKQKEEGRDEEGSRIHKHEGAKSKRYSEGRKKEERERERRIKEDRDRGRRYKETGDEEEPKTKIMEARVTPTETEEQHSLPHQQKGVPEARGGDSRRTKEVVEVEAGNEVPPEKVVPRKKREKDPRVERRIRNKDRPSMALYRPGQSRLSSRMRSDREEGADTSSSSPSPVMPDTKKLVPPKREEGTTHREDNVGAKEDASVDNEDSASSQKDDYATNQEDVIAMQKEEDAVVHDQECTTTQKEDGITSHEENYAITHKDEDDMTQKNDDVTNQIENSTTNQTEENYNDKKENVASMGEETE